MIPDTTFIIDLLRKNQNALRKAQELENKNLPILLTTITIFELWQGLDIENKEREKNIQDKLEKFSLITLDLESAKLAGTIFKDLEKKGLTIDSEDSMIAGITLSRNDTILTRNLKHFERIRNLKIETY